MYRGGRNPLDRCEVCGLHFIRHRVLRCPVDNERKHNAKRCSELPEGGGGCDPSWKCWKRPEWCIRKARAKSAPTQHQETGGRQQRTARTRLLLEWGAWRIYVTNTQNLRYLLTKRDLDDQFDARVDHDGIERYATLRLAEGALRLIKGAEGREG
jgi:hypothetical protein